MAVYKPRRGTLEETNPADTLTSDLQPPELLEIKPLWAVVLCWSRLSRLMQVPTIMQARQSWGQGCSRERDKDLLLGTHRAGQLERQAKNNFSVQSGGEWGTDTAAR